MTNETFRLNSETVDEFKSLETTAVDLCFYSLVVPSTAVTNIFSRSRLSSAPLSNRDFGNSLEQRHLHKTPTNYRRQDGQHKLATTEALHAPSVSDKRLHVFRRHGHHQCLSTNARVCAPSDGPRAVFSWTGKIFPSIEAASTVGVIMVT